MGVLGAQRSRKLWAVTVDVTGLVGQQTETSAGATRFALGGRS
jgi:hypothetical protein